MRLLRYTGAKCLTPYKKRFHKDDILSVAYKSRYAIVEVRHKRNKTERLLPNMGPLRQNNVSAIFIVVWVKDILAKREGKEIECLVAPPSRHSSGISERLWTASRNGCRELWRLHPHYTVMVRLFTKFHSRPVAHYHFDLTGTSRLRK